jgi:hypothetical protein
MLIYPRKTTENQIVRNNVLTPRLTDKQIAEIKAMPIPRIELAKKYGYTDGQIKRALNGECQELRKILGVWKSGE